QSIAEKEKETGTRIKAKGAVAVRCRIVVLCPVRRIRIRRGAKTAREKAHKNGKIRRIFTLKMKPADPLFTQSK
ncbi:MAG: hypothetical protein IKR53_04380, partial [Clostridia bacterium]|nr:hypothetical protein [Clostridia bacterium]